MLDDQQPKNQREDPEAFDEGTTLEMYKIHRREQRNTILGVVALVMTGTVILGWKLIDSIEKPSWWVVLLELLGAALLTGSGTIVITLKWKYRFQRYIKEHHTRTKALEEKVDPHRESSGVNEDGTTPLDF